MQVINNDKVLFVDVDDTLVIWEGVGYRPHKRHIEYLYRFYERNQPIIVWSAGGYEWAARIVKELGIEDIVSLVMSKPAWYMDDKKVEEFMPEANRIYLEE